MSESTNNIDLSLIDFNDKKLIAKFLEISKKTPDQIIDLPNGNHILDGMLFKTEQEVISFCLDQKNNVEKAFFDDGRLIVHGHLFKDIQDFKDYVSVGKKLLKFFNFFRRLFGMKKL